MPLGRNGHAVSRQGDHDGRDRLVVDTTTGQPLAFESTFTEGGEQFHTYEAIKKMSCTDEEPELPARQRSTNLPSD
ncbi:hypothetical protein [Nonomuraea basaltis]|uniref:hypothetical protein n=1 Tax=Nonomuraea basaltis TaxID=2495887 RepID=UPI00110C4457|nr:hypothetical protein [Nonomuraea basaltis]TMR89901.1 hypothetical protein EJK15_58360 [Nonomuraea basaltis]